MLVLCGLPYFHITKCLGNAAWKYNFGRQLTNWLFSVLMICEGMRLASKGGGGNLFASYHWPGLCVGNKVCKQVKDYIDNRSTIVCPFYAASCQCVVSMSVQCDWGIGYTFVFQMYRYTQSWIAKIAHCEHIGYQMPVIFMDTGKNILHRIYVSIAIIFAAMT